MTVSVVKDKVSLHWFIVQSTTVRQYNTHLFVLHWSKIHPAQMQEAKIHLTQMQQAKIHFTQMQ